MVKTADKNGLWTFVHTDLTFNFVECNLPQISDFKWNGWKAMKLSQFQNFQKIEEGKKEPFMFSI